MSNNFNDGLTDGIRKFLLAGIGAAATTAEKSQEILEDLVKKGELTVEQGKALNQELKHTVKENLGKDQPQKDGAKDIDSFVDSLSDEELSDLKAKLADK